MLSSITICYCLIRKVDPKELIVGWYFTRFRANGGSVPFHEFYSREVPNPVHLTVDTSFSNRQASIKAYVSINLSLGDPRLASQFLEIPLDLHIIEAERIGFAVTLSFEHHQNSIKSGREIEHGCPDPLIFED